MVRAPEEYTVRRNGFKLFYLLLCSRSICCLIGQLVGSLCGDTERSLVQTKGEFVGWGLLSRRKLCCWKGQPSWDTQRYRSGLPNDCSSVRWNVRSFVFFKLTSVPYFGPVWCFSYPPLFLKNYVKANFNLWYWSCVDQSPSALVLWSQVSAGLRLIWFLGLFPFLWPWLSVSATST